MTKYHPRLKLVHGYQARKHPCYVTWFQMKRRCLNPKEAAYPNYGGRGIFICQEWADSFEQFALDMGLPPTNKHTLDRIDNEDGYYKENCRWATRTEQCLNRRLFSNNSTGQTGILKLKNGCYKAKYQEKGVSYNLGQFKNIEDGLAYRCDFIKLLHVNKSEALKMCQRRVRLDSTTKIKGIIKHKQGYTVKITVNKNRLYLGFSKTLEGAINILNEYKRTCND